MMSFDLQQVFDVTLMSSSKFLTKSTNLDICRTGNVTFSKQQEENTQKC